MQERPSPAALRAVVRTLTTAAAEDVLREALDGSGERLRAWSVRSVHRRGSTSVAVVLRVDLVDRWGRERDRLYVAHASRRPVPPGPTRVLVDGTPVHLWAFPHDPYLPGLASAVTVTAAASLLARVGQTPPDRPAIHTRSYRPTRRAVVELRPGSASPPAAFVKLLGGRDPGRVQRRTADLVAVHDALHAAGVPVPAVLDHDLDAGRVVLRAVTGRTLRDLLRNGGDLPPPATLLDLVEQVRRTESLPGGGDPDGFADVTRHVELLAERLSHRAADLEQLAAAVAAVGGPLGTVHGDLHDGQLVVEDGRVTGLLDVDGAGTGRVAHDLGRLLAGVEASALAATGGASAQAATYLDDVAARAAELCPAADLARATAGAWVGLATGPLRVASPTWELETEQRLDRALAWVRRAN